MFFGQNLPASQTLAHVHNLLETVQVRQLPGILDGQFLPFKIVLAWQPVFVPIANPDRLPEIEEIFVPL